MNLQKLFDGAVDTAKATWDGKMFMPMWLLQQESGDIICVATPFSSVAEKNAVDMFIRKMIKEKNVHSYIFTAESWRLSVPKDEELPRDSIENEPDREEIIMIIGVDAVGNTLCGQMLITRHPDKLGPMEIMDVSASGSNRFTDMFPKTKVH